MKNLLIFILFLGFYTGAIHAQAKAEPRLKNGRYKSTTGDYRITGWVINHKQQGKWITKQHYSDSTGKQKWVLIEERHFRKGRQHGRYLSFTPEGDTIDVTTYRKGLPYGESRTYRQGALTAIEHYDSNGKNTGLNAYYHESGELYLVKQIDSAGVERSWYFRIDGSLLRYGVAHCGEQIVYTYASDYSVVQAQDTLPVEISLWKNKQQNNPQTKYVNGVKISEVAWRDGRLEGPLYMWTNGVLVREANFSGGQKNGAERHWTNSGKLWVENNFHDGTQHGLQAEFDTTTGLALKKEWLVEGVVDSMIRYAPGGRMTYRAGNYDTTHTRFTYTTFHDNGALATTGRMNRNEEWGEQQQWYDNGVRKATIMYAGGKPDGAVDYWNEKGVHVFHGEAAMGFDSIPELVWSESGQSLRYGTKAYVAQREKYQPYDLFLYSDTVFFTHAVHVVAELPLNNWSSRGTRSFLELQDTLGINKRVPPKFTGGFAAQDRYFKSQVKYPQMEFDQGKSGNVYLTFTVEKDGRVTGVKIAKQTFGAPGLGREAQRLVNAMPDWIPASKNGKPIRSMCVMKFVWALE